VPQLWDFGLYAMQNSLKFKVCIVLSYLSLWPSRYHDNLFPSLSFSFFYKLLSYCEIWVMCKLVLHCASIFYLHSLKKVTSSFGIVPLGKFRYRPPPSKCTWRRDNYCSFHNILFPSVHIYHHLENDFQPIVIKRKHLNWVYNCHSIHMFI